MNRLECSLVDKGYKTITGVDEAGRGPLAGPVVAAAVTLPEGYKNKQIRDSKKISPAKRESLFFTITSEAESYALGIATHFEVDLYNIHRASLLAMQRAVKMLDKTPDFLLVDGRFPIPDLHVEQITVKSGDTSVLSIAAASVVAKVTRDAIMERYHDAFPQYNFAGHKGYPTKEHRRAIEKFGPCPIHRKTFRGIGDER
jgi:ribonuclease HII